ncbi:MAG: hypothetical protein ACKVZH_28720 [Blastocatellia bacterium]
MTPQQMENAITFIVEQQARFAVDHQLFQQDLTRFKEVQEIQAKAQAETQAAMAQRMKEIMAVQSVHQEVMEQLTQTSLNAFKSIAELRNSQKETDERLNILINVVENHISNHNGSHRIEGNL